MKKTLQRLSIVILLVGLVGQSYGQVELSAKGVKGHEILTDGGPEMNLKHKAHYENWKFPVDAITQLTTLDRFVNFLFPDSTVQFVASDGEARFQSWHSVGAVFTPNDENLELADDNVFFSRYNEYKVDSVYFPYLYVRYVDSMDMGGTNVEVVDTLIVQFFKYDQMDVGSFTPDGGDPEIFMKPNNFTPSLLGANNAVYEVKILLKAEDSTSRPSTEGWGSRGRIVPLPANFNIGSDAATPDLEFKNSFGFSIAYKTMLPYNHGDTIEARNGATITNKLNYFGHSFFSNSSVAVSQTKYVNNSWWVPSLIRYGEDQNNWENSIPGNAYFDDRYLNYAVYVETESLGVNKIEDVITYGIYPNPISRNETLKADFSLVNATDVTIEIYDLLGNNVMSVTDGYFVSGNHSIDINISSLTPGMYIYSVKAGNASSSKKISIVE